MQPEFTFFTVDAHTEAINFMNLNCCVYHKGYKKELIEDLIALTILAFQSRASVWRCQRSWFNSVASCCDFWNVFLFPRYMILQNSRLMNQCLLHLFVPELTYIDLKLTQNSRKQCTIMRDKSVKNHNNTCQTEKNCIAHWLKGTCGNICLTNPQALA